MEVLGRESKGLGEELEREKAGWRDEGERGISLGLWLPFLERVSKK